MFIETLVFLLSVFLTYLFFKKWYKPLHSKWPPIENPIVKHTLISLPLISFIIYLFTLTLLASFDVVDNGYYILYYILLGYAWLFFGLFVMAYCFDMSLIDDVLNMNNRAALFSIAGGFLGLSVIYAGANIGDGPGWWCVIFAGALGLIAWVLMALIINLFTKVFERITIDRDIPCGIRIGFYLFASGIIFGRASAGDWTSFRMTIIEFSAGWPALPLSLLAIIVEYYYIFKSKRSYNRTFQNIITSIFWSIIYTGIAILSIMLIPLY